MIYQHKVSTTIIQALTSHLPYSLALLRRLEDPQRSSSSLALATFPESSPSPYGLFMAAYIDQSRRGESQAWFFCSAGELEFEFAKTQLRDILSYIRLGQPTATQDREDKEGLLLVIASLNTLLVDAVQDICTAGGVRLSQEYMKYLFHHAPPLPPLNLVDGLEFGELRPEDMDRVIATSSVRRHRDTLLLWKNAALFMVTGDKRIPIAWAFIGFDGTLATWWVEEEWRARGYGTAVARKVMQHWRNGCVGENTTRLGHTDVALNNWNSRGGMVRLGGVEGWIVRWLYVDLNGLWK